MAFITLTPRSHDAHRYLHQSIAMLPVAIPGEPPRFCRHHYSDSCTPRISDFYFLPSPSMTHPKKKAAAKKPQLPPALKMWAIAKRWRDRSNDLAWSSGIGYWYGFHDTRKEAIAAHVARWGEPWEESYREGDRCIRVLIKPL